MYDFLCYNKIQEEKMTAQKLAALSPAETQILRLVYQLKEGTVRDVCNKLPSDWKIAYATVQTLLRRLKKKGYVNFYKKGKSHVFYPIIKKDKVIKKSVSDFLEQLFGGDPIPLLQHLAEHEDIEASDIENLKKLLNKKP
jgi:predicted transcriptional regulator